MKLIASEYCVFICDHFHTSWRNREQLKSSFCPAQNCDLKCSGFFCLFSPFQVLPLSQQCNPFSLCVSGFFTPFDEQYQRREASAARKTRETKELIYPLEKPPPTTFDTPTPLFACSTLNPIFSLYLRFYVDSIYFWMQTGSEEMFVVFINIGEMRFSSFFATQNCVFGACRRFLFALASTLLGVGSWWLQFQCAFSFFFFFYFPWW